MSPHLRLTLVFGITQILLYSSSFYFPILVSGEIAEEFGTSRAVVLGAYSWAVILNGIFAPIAGRWMERSGGRSTLVTGTLLQMTALVMMATLPNLWGWYAAWTVLGVGMAFSYYDAAQACIGRQLGAAARRTFVSFAMISGFVTLIGWPVSAALNGAYGWRWTAIIYVTIHLCVTLPVHFFGIPRNPPPAPPPLPPVVMLDGGKARRRVIILLAVFFTLRAFISSMMNVQILLLLTGLGLSTAAAIAAAALIGPGQVASRVLDFTFGRRRTPFFSAWIGSALLPVACVLPILGAPAFLLAVGFGMSNGIQTINRGTLPLYLLGPRGIASLLGKLAFPAQIAMALAPPLTAPLIAALPTEWVLVLVALTTGVAMLCLIPMKPLPDAQAGTR